MKNHYARKLLAAALLCSVLSATLPAAARALDGAGLTNGGPATNSAADSTPTATSNSAASSSTGSTSTVNQQHLATIKSKGDGEISRRLSQLNKLDSLVTAATHITASDKSSLVSEVNSEIAGLTSLKTKLDAETTLTAAIADAQSIFSDYRVYALITPKVWLVKTADDQQTAEAKLTTLASKLQTRFAVAQTAGKNVASLQTMLSDMNTQINAAQAISSAIESKVLPLQPTDYNSDHTILSGDAAQLKTAHADNLAAAADAQKLISDLKNL